MSPRDIAGKAAELRRRFDEAFALPLEQPAGSAEALLGITAGGRQYAIRLRDISALLAARHRIVAVPAATPELIGITAVRGEILPVFSIARLLGMDATAEEVRWMVVAGEGKDALALAFSVFDGYFAAETPVIFPPGGGTDRPYTGETVRHNGALRGIIDVGALAGQLRSRAPGGAQK